MTINILHLYYDLMNLYGENGNIKALIYSLKEQNIKVVVDRLSIGDDIDFIKYDLVYIGCGTETNELIVLKDILKYKKELKEYIENNKFILATGNSFELFGKNIEDNKALNIFDYESYYLDKRVVKDYIKDDILAFQNRGSRIENNTNPLFDEEIGFNYKNFYGTYLIGPILVRSPEFNKALITKLVKSKNKNFKFKTFDLKLDKKAHDSYLNTYVNTK